MTMKRIWEIQFNPRAFGKRELVPVGWVYKNEDEKEFHTFFVGQEHVDEDPRECPLYYEELLNCMGIGNVSIQRGWVVYWKSLVDEEGIEGLIKKSPSRGYKVVRLEDTTDKIFPWRKMQELRRTYSDT